MCRCRCGRFDLKGHGEHAFVSVGGMATNQDRFEGLRRSAACTHLSRDQVGEQVEITASLIAEREHIRGLLSHLPDSFGEVRQILNELHRVVR